MERIPDGMPIFRQNAALRFDDSDESEVRVFDDSDVGCVPLFFGAYLDCTRFFGMNNVVECAGRDCEFFFDA